MSVDTQRKRIKKSTSDVGILLHRRGFLLPRVLAMVHLRKIPHPGLRSSRVE
jgi:hypothetical protein